MSWLLVVYRSPDPPMVQRAWSLIESCAEELMPGNEGRYRRLLLDLLPAALYALIRALGSWGDDDRDRAIIALSGQLPQPAMNRLLDRRARQRW